MPPYLIPSVLCVALAFILFALCDYALWEARHWWAERKYQEWEETHKEKST